MKIFLYSLFLLFFLFTGCETTTQTFLPATQPDDLVVQYIDGLNGKEFYLSNDTCYAIFSVNGEKKRIDFKMTKEEFTKVFEALQVNNFSRIDTVKIPFENLPEEARAPVFDIKVSWGKNTVEKYIAVDTDIKEEWKEKFDNITASIQVMSYAAIEKMRRDFTLELDKTLYPPNSFLTIDFNTYFSPDSLFYYNTTEQGDKDALNVRALDGKNRITIFINKKNPGMGEGFNIANSSFDIDVNKDMKGLKFYMEKDSVKWSPISE